MQEIEMILAILKEVDEELTYNESHAKEEEKAKAKSRRDGKDSWHWHEYMPPEYNHAPRKSVILDDLKLVRRLALKISKKVEGGYGT